MPFAELPTGHFFYEEQGDGPAVVFTHGIFMDHSSFDEQLKILSDSYRCIAWDSKNHGETETGRLSYWDHARDLLGLMDHLGIDKAVLAGMSQGGFISLRAAIAAPERVRGLVLIDTQAGLEDPVAVQGYEAMLEEWMTNGPNRMMLETVAQIINGDGVDNEPWMEKWRATSNDRVRNAFDSLVERDDLTEELGRIECPAIVLHGDQDVAIPMERAEALATGLPRCGEVVVVPGAGHSAQMSAPDTVNTHIREFLEGLDQGSRT
jgi:pimeloyl-ACP methyl ester carboxylesterase